MTCPYCDGRGCEECDGSGQRWHEGFEVDGATVMVSGTGAGGLTDEMREFFTVISRLALARMDEPDQQD